MKVKDIITKEPVPLLLGGLLGAGAALLLAPRSGKETIRKITDAAGSVKDRASAYIENGKDQVLSAIDRGKDFVQVRKNLVTVPLGACVDAYGRERSRLAKGR